MTTTGNILADRIKILRQDAKNTTDTELAELLHRQADKLMDELLYRSIFGDEAWEALEVSTVTA